ncbi:hypothetical protein MTO96_019373 [Rhipicephalus appendiculatus]
MERPGIARSSPSRRRHSPSNGVPSSQQGTSKPSMPQHQQTVPRPRYSTSRGSCALAVPKATRDNPPKYASDHVHDVAHSAKNAKVRKLPCKRVLGKRVLRSNSANRDEVDAANTKKAKLQRSPCSTSRKPVLKSNTQSPGGAHSPADEEKAELQKLPDGVLQKPVTGSNSERFDNGSTCHKEYLQNPPGKAPKKPVRKSAVEGSNIDHAAYNKKAKLRKTANRVPQKLMPNSDTEDSSDVDDPAHIRKTKGHKSPNKILRKHILESDTDDSDNDPTWGKKEKLQRLPDMVQQKAKLVSNGKACRNMQPRRPLKKSHRGPGRPKRKVPKDPHSTVAKCEGCEEEQTQAVKAHEAFKLVASASDIAQRVVGQAEGNIYSVKPPFRKPDSRMTTGYKCCVTGCPYAQKESPIGLWLFPLPDEEAEASLRSQWLQNMSIDNNVNRPLSPRVCFKHFDAQKHFVTVSHRMCGLKLDAVPFNFPQPLRTSEKGKLTDAFHGSTEIAEQTSNPGLGQACSSTTGAREKPHSMTAASEVQKTQSTISTTMVKELLSMALADAAEAQSMIAGVKPVPQLTHTAVMVQGNKVYDFCRCRCRVSCRSSFCIST